MSRSTDASKGTPDDEGRLADGSDEAAAEIESADEVDAVPAEDDSDEVDAEIDEVDSDDVESDEVEESDDDAEQAEVVAAAAATRSTGDRAARTPARKPAARTSASAGRPTSRGPQETRRGPIAAIVLFVRQVIAELRKVVRPTGRELMTYVAVVIVFVIVVMAYIGALDFAIGKLILWAFGG